MPAGVYLYGQGNVLLATSIVPPVEEVPHAPIV